MPLRIRQFILGVSLVMGAGYAAADDVDGSFAVRGVGTAQCSQYASSYDQAETKSLQRVIHWMQGYLSARNKISDGVFDLVPVYRAEDLVALLNAVCEKNPDIRLEAATNSLISLFKPTWVTSSSELSILEDGERNVPIRNAVLAQIQQALADNGFYDGVVDGVYGTRSANALRTYQSEQDLALTGLPDMQTLLRLLIGNQ
jgi:hypothetical protein